MFHAPRAFKSLRILLLSESRCWKVNYLQKTETDRDRKSIYSIYYNMSWGANTLTDVYTVMGIDCRYWPSLSRHELLFHHYVPTNASQYQIVVHVIGSCLQSISWLDLPWGMLANKTYVMLCFCLNILQNPHLFHTTDILKTVLSLFSCTNNGIVEHHADPSMNLCGSSLGICTKKRDQIISLDY